MEIAKKSAKDVMKKNGEWVAIDALNDETGESGDIRIKMASAQVLH